jgi:cobalamin synthase
MNRSIHMDQPRDTRIHDGEAGAAGLMALVVVLILTVCTAAALLLTLPQTFDGAAVAVASPHVSTVSSAEPTFHEMYAAKPAAVEPAEVPTF